tara:strand:- start:46 stop:303 length:258 start_codon:yes stop_codon:yes gene_type:complete
MAQEIGEQTKVTLDLKTIGTIVGFTIALATTYFTSFFIIKIYLIVTQLTVLVFAFRIDGGLSLELPEDTTEQIQEQLTELQSNKF